MYRLSEHLEKLKQFEATARLGKVSYAAKSLNMSQAAVSRSIKVLEDILDKQLFTRKQAGVELTPEGKTLFEFSKNILEQSIQIESAIRNKDQQNQKHIKVGTHESLAVYFWPSFLKKFSKENTKISLTSDRIDGLVNGLLNHHYQFILSVEPLPHAKIESFMLYETPLSFFASKGFKDSLSIKELNDLPILTDSSSHSRQGLPMTSFLASQGLDLKNIFGLNSFEAAIRLAEQGLGIAIIPQSIATKAAIKNLKEIKIKSLSIKNFGRHKLCCSILRKNKSTEVRELAKNIQIFAAKSVESTQSKGL